MLSSSTMIRSHAGRILRKRRHRTHLVLTVQGDKEDLSTSYFVPKRADAKAGEEASSDPYLRDQLYLGALVQVEYASDRPDGWTATTTPTMDAVRSIRLLRAAPDPHAVNAVLPLILEGLIPPSVLCATGEEIEEVRAAAAAAGSETPEKEKKNGGGSEKRAKIRGARYYTPRWIRRLKGLSDEREFGGSHGHGGRRHRPPHTSRKEVEVLNRLDGSLRQRHPDLRVPVRVDPDADGDDEDQQQVGREKGPPLPLNLNADTASAPSPELSRRMGYLEGKKGPQIEWIVRRIRAMMAAKDKVGREGPPYRHVVDVGGGRGDLAVHIAAAFPDIGRVTVVDLNKKSLEAGREYARTRGVQERMRFECDDFASFFGGDGGGGGADEPPVDLVVALHACGDLSDLALRFALERGADFCVCPCCYTKRYISAYTPGWWGMVASASVGEEESKEAEGSSKEQARDRIYAEGRILGKLAEIDERPDHSRKARVLIDGLRLHSIEGSGKYESVSLEEYDNTISKRNLVLVGLVSSGDTADCTQTATCMPCSSTTV